MKSLYIFKRANFIGTISVLLLLFPALTFAVSYTPGQTLDPSCSPSDPTCLVINTTITAANINATSTTATSTFAGYVNIGGTGSSILNINNTSAINPFEIHSANAQGLLLYTHSDTGFRGAAISLFKSRGTQASPTAVQAGDIFSYFNSGGYDGAAYVSGSAIEPVAAENWTTGTHGTNLTFWTNSVGTLTFAQRMILSANGKLGIGTTTPWAQLSVTATSNASFPQFVVASSTAVSFIVDQSGNVGIGTSSPSSLLTVSASNPTASYDLPNNALIFGSPFRPASLSQTNFSTAPASGSYTAHLYDTQLTYTSNTGGVNYGIVNNVIDPTSVSANVPSMTGIISYVTHLGSGTVASFLQGSQSVAVNKSPTTISTIIGANNQALNSGVSGATSTIAEGSQSLLSNASPYGLIGTGYAVRLLVQNANANATINTAYGLALDSFTNTGTIGSTYGVYVGNVTAGTQTNHPYSFYALDSSAWNYFGGAVGIGTSTPTAQLSTTGTVRFSNFGAGTLTTDASGNLSVSSDERLKNIDGSFTRGLSDIMKLSPISYHWNQLSGLDTTTSYSGFSAQNVQTAIPEAVGSSTNGFLTLQDRPILAATVNAIKDIGSIGGDFRHALITWLGASDNGLSKVRADQICAKTSAGTDVCMTGDQMQTLLNQQYQSGGIGGTPTPSVSDNVNLDASSSETVPPDSTQSSDILITQ